LLTDPVRLALVIAGALLLAPIAPSTGHLVFLIAIAVTLAIATRRGARRGTLLVLLVGGILVRLAIVDRVGSDVLTVTEAAIRRVLAGGNPYGIGYNESSPPGSPFPYGPVALLWYVPAGSSAELLEIGTGILVTALLALRGRLVGLAVYAASTLLINSSIDGSNDTTLGLLILAAFLAAERWPLAGAAILGLAVGFKLSALAFVPMFIAWGGIRVGGVVVSASIIAWAPVIADWGVSSFLRSVQLANETHRIPTWSLGRIVNDLTGSKVDLLDTLRYGFGGALALVTLAMRNRTLDTVILTGSAVYVVTLFAGNWASYAYFAGLAPIICWHIDRWLGVPTTPWVRWPLRATRGSTAPDPTAAGADTAPTGG
jgi:hypothetical protein